MGDSEICRRCGALDHCAYHFEYSHGGDCPEGDRTGEPELRDPDVQRVEAGGQVPEDPERREGLQPIPLGPVRDAVQLLRVSLLIGAVAANQMI